MNKADEYLEYYSTYWWSSFTKIIPQGEWGDKKTAKEYLAKFWLSMNDYKEEWEIILNKVFINKNIGLPEIVFAKQYEILPMRGGCLFIKEDFTRLQQCFLEVGDKYFVVIENTFMNKLQEPAARLKFPTNISWNELMSGNFISSVVFEMSNKEYFVFGESGLWGKYSANDYINPLDIIGFESEHSLLFREKLKQYDDEWLEIKSWLPSSYVSRIENFIT